MPADARILATPVVLRAAAALAFAGDTTVPVVLDGTKIQNTYRLPIEITEMLVTSRLSVQHLAGVTNAPSLAGTALELDLAVDRFRMTNDFVPFSTLAPWNSGEDESAVTVGFGANQTLSFNQRRVLFPQPIRLRPGVGFSVRARRRVDAVTNVDPARGETVSVAFIGRFDPSGVNAPTAQAIPFWMGTRLIYTPATAYAQQSGEAEFRNPLTQTLEAERVIIARQVMDNTIGVDIRVGAEAINDFVYDPEVQIRWPNGDYLNADRTVQSQSAFMREHALSVSKFEIPPLAKVDVTISTDVADAKVRPDVAVSIFGTRREVL